MASTWTEEQGLRLELAIEVLSGEIGRRNAALRKLLPHQAADRVRLERERTMIVHLSNRLHVDDERRIDAILERNLSLALSEEEPSLQYAV